MAYIKFMPSPSLWNMAYTIKFMSPPSLWNMAHQWLSPRAHTIGQRLFAEPGTSARSKKSNDGVLVTHDCLLRCESVCMTGFSYTWLCPHPPSHKHPPAIHAMCFLFSWAKAHQLAVLHPLDQFWQPSAIRVTLTTASMQRVVGVITKCNIFRRLVGFFSYVHSIS